MMRSKGRKSIVMETMPGDSESDSPKLYCVNYCKNGPDRLDGK